MSRSATLRAVETERVDIQAGEDSDNTLRIDELARMTGLSVRNIRSHHERGLLPPPAVRGRVGYYGPAHIERIHLIQSLQSEGLKLEGIKRLLEDSHTDSAGLLRVKQAADAFAETETGEVLTEFELLERLGVAPEHARKVLADAQRLGIVVPLGQGHYQVLSPSLIDAAEAVVRGGVKLEHALRLVEDVGRHSEAISKRFVKTFIDDVWRPFAAAGMPQDEWARIGEAMESMRPAAAMVVVAVFRQRLADEVETAFAQIVKRMSQGKD